MLKYCIQGIAAMKNVSSSYTGHALFQESCFFNICAFKVIWPQLKNTKTLKDGCLKFCTLFIKYLVERKQLCMLLYCCVLDPSALKLLSCSVIYL
jgi:hypothetical protein